jgi:hypothetical protein
MLVGLGLVAIASAPPRCLKSIPWDLPGDRPDVVLIGPAEIAARMPHP